ncbi:MAG TPA: hypothetical protein VJ970_08270 [Flavobacteriaceae bacterium]|nr:hypothetical protein [Flavobacteriaceae bacterium]
MVTKELIGKVLLQEYIDTLDGNKIPGTFVINVPNPLKSYYARFTQIDKPNSIIFVTKSPTSFEKILRATRKINAAYNLNLDGAKCEVQLNSKKLSGIRLRGINRYSDIEKIQLYYKAEDFEFCKNEPLKNQDALIRINRFFTIEEMEKGIYKSATEENVYYVEIPRYMPWDEFRKHTFDIKDNISDHAYDVVTGIFYVDGGITEVLRIAKINASLDNLKSIQQKYIDRLD